GRPVGPLLVAPVGCWPVRAGHPVILTIASAVALAADVPLIRGGGGCVRFHGRDLPGVLIAETRSAPHRPSIRARRRCRGSAPEGTRPRHPGGGRVPKCQQEDQMTHHVVSILVTEVGRGGDERATATGHGRLNLP